jgi:hypothetical protein
MPSGETGEQFTVAPGERGNHGPPGVVGERWQPRHSRVLSGRWTPDVRRFDAGGAGRLRRRGHAVSRSIGPGDRGSGPAVRRTAVWRPAVADRPVCRWHAGWRPRRRHRAGQRRHRRRPRARAGPGRCRRTPCSSSVPTGRPARPRCPPKAGSPPGRAAAATRSGRPRAVQTLCTCSSAHRRARVCCSATMHGVGHPGRAIPGTAWAPGSVDGAALRHAVRLIASSAASASRCEAIGTAVDDLVIALLAPVNGRANPDLLASTCRPARRRRTERGRPHPGRMRTSGRLRRWIVSHPPMPRIRGRSQG